MLKKTTQLIILAAIIISTNIQSGHDSPVFIEPNTIKKSSTINEKTKTPYWQGRTPNELCNLANEINTSNYKAFWKKLNGNDNEVPQNADKLLKWQLKVFAAIQTNFQSRTHKNPTKGRIHDLIAAYINKPTDGRKGMTIKELSELLALTGRTINRPVLEKLWSTHNPIKIKYLQNMTKEERKHLKKEFKAKQLKQLPTSELRNHAQNVIRRYIQQRNKRKQQYDCPCRAQQG